LPGQGHAQGIGDKDEIMAGQVTMLKTDTSQVLAGLLKFWLKVKLKDSIAMETDIMLFPVIFLFYGGAKFDWLHGVAKLYGRGIQLALITEPEVKI